MGKCDILEKFNCVCVLPVENRPPILIFKNFKKGFYYKQVSFEAGSKIISDFEVFWQGKSLGTQFPNEIKKQYGERVWKFLHEKEFFYYDFEIPKEIIEIPVSLILRKTKHQVFNPKYITPVRNTLRQFEIMAESRGNYPRKGKLKAIRDRFIIREYIKMGKPERLPIMELQRRWSNKVNLMFNNSKAADQNQVSEATIRRTIKGYNKK